MSFAKRARDNYFTLNGRSSADWGIVVSKDNGFDAPERDVSAIEVPGRNGELHIDNGRWRNIDVTYNDCVIERDFTEQFGNFRAYCARQRGYQRLEDTFHPDEYRLADMTQGIKVSSVGTRYNSGKFDLTFNCKPQRFLKSGEDPILFIAPTSSAMRLETPTFTYPESGYDIQRIIVSVASFPTSGSVTITRTLSDSAGISQDVEDSITVTDYDAHTFSGPPTYYQWSLTIEAGASSDSLDDIAVEVEYGYALINDASVSLAGSVIARKHEIINPTGFKCNPLIQIIGGRLPLSYISDGSERWVMAWNLDSSINPDEFFMDCENEYIYYVEDGIRRNLTNYLTITHYDKNGNEMPLSFPNMGEDTTNLYFSASPGIVLIYPHWYTI